MKRGFLKAHYGSCEIHDQSSSSPSTASQLKRSNANTQSPQLASRATTSDDASLKKVSALGANELLKGLPMMKVSSSQMEAMMTKMKKFGINSSNKPGFIEIPLDMSFNTLIDHTDEIYPIPFPTGTDKTSEQYEEEYGDSSIRLCTNDVDSDDDDVFCGWVVFEELNKKIPLKDTHWKPPPRLSNISYRISEVPVRGKALLATSIIEAGETIFLERPLAITPAISVFDKETYEDVFEKLLNRLSPQYKAAYFDLADSKPQSYGSKALRIMSTNGIQVIFPQSKLMPHYSAVFPILSRCNHSCSPNTVYGFSPTTLVAEIRAMHTIKPGEEITIPYGNILQAYSRRQEEFKRRYLFDCKCEICSLKPSEQERSDERREMIHTLEMDAPLQMWKEAMNPESDKTSKKKAGTWTPKQYEIARKAIERIINTQTNVLHAMEAEKLNDMRFRPIRWLARAYAALGDEENTRKWVVEGRRALKITSDNKLAFRDSDKTIVKKWDLVIKDVTCHPEWNSLKKKKEFV